MAWPATEAKAKFSEVLDKAETVGPQLVTRRKREFVLMTREEWDSIGTKKPKESLVEFFRKSPAYGIDFEAKRVPITPCKVGF